MYEFVGLLDVNGTRLKSTARRLREPVSPIYEGAPHGLFIPYLERLNRDLLAFVKGS